MRFPDSESRRRHAIALMNHGHALMRLENPAALVASLSAYEEAIALLRDRPVDVASIWINSLAAACMNRGQLLHRIHGTARADDALASFTESITVLSSLPSDAHPWLRRNLAGSLLNRANLRLDISIARRTSGGTEHRAADSHQDAISPVRGTQASRLPKSASRRLDSDRTTAGQSHQGGLRAIDPSLVSGETPDTAGGTPALPGSFRNPDALQMEPSLHRALADARAALELVRASEYEHPVDAELALKARRALGDALGQIVAQTREAQRQELIATEAGDIVDEALALVRFWKRLGCEQFREVEVRFFRFGAQLCRMHQPHFMTEFLFEHLEADDPVVDDDLQRIALGNIEAALAADDGQCRTGRPLVIDDPETERRLQTRRDLELAGSVLTSPSAFA